MTTIEIPELRKIAVDQQKDARDYCEARRLAGILKTRLDLLLSRHLPEIRAEKPNCGIEMALLMLVEKNADAAEIYAEWQESEALYKGLEKVVDAGATRISFEQSILKYFREGEKYGV